MLKVKDTQKTYIILGAGGTGSWLAGFLSKLDITDRVFFVDGDVVEHKNVLRQNFTFNEVGDNKAMAIMERYGFQAIDEFVSSVDMLKEITQQACDRTTIPVIVGCLDNNASRKLVHDYFMDEQVQDVIWLDSGNAERYGQTYIAVKQDGNILWKSPIDLDSTFQNYEGDERRPDQISCAEHSESAPQNVTANVMAATTLFNVINIIEENGALLANKFAWDTKFNLLSGERI